MSQEDTEENLSLELINPFVELPTMSKGILRSLLNYILKLFKVWSDKKEYERLIKAFNDRAALYHKAFESHRDLAKSHSKDLKEVKQSLAKLDKLPEIISKLVGEVNEMKVTIKEIKHDREIQQRLRNLREQIKTIGFNMNKVYKSQIDSSTTSMIIEGCDKGGVFFSSMLYILLEKGADYLDPEQVKEDALMYMRSIRSQYVGVHKLNVETAKRIKNEVAYNMILELVSNVQLLKEGVMGEDKAAAFENLALEFVRNFIKKTFQILSSNDTK